MQMVVSSLTGLGPVMIEWEHCRAHEYHADKGESVCEHCPGASDLSLKVLTSPPGISEDNEDRKDDKLASLTHYQKRARVFTKAIHEVFGGQDPLRGTYWRVRSSPNTPHQSCMRRLPLKPCHFADFSVPAQVKFCGPHHDLDAARPKPEEAQYKGLGNIIGPRVWPE